MNKKIIYIIIAIILAGGIFYGGMKYDQGQNNFAGRNFGNNLLGAGAGAGTRTGNSRGESNFRNGAGLIAGEVISVDKESFTVKMSDGGSKIVYYTASTTVSHLTPATTSDLGSGKQVTVNGMANSDGTITARMVQIR